MAASARRWSPLRRGVPSCVLNNDWSREQRANRRVRPEQLRIGIADVHGADDRTNRRLMHLSTRSCGTDESVEHRADAAFARMCLPTEPQEIVRGERYGDGLLRHAMFIRCARVSAQGHESRLLTRLPCDTRAYNSIR